MKFATKTIHSGLGKDPKAGAVMTPIYQTSTYIQKSPGDHKGYEYGRTHNPTREALEKNIAALENGKEAICFASGMAAMDAVLKLLSAGDEIIATNDLYGGSYRIIRTIYERFGMKGHFVDMTNTKNLEKSINKKTRLIWVETPTNPMLNIVDIKKVCKIAKKHNILVCVDNTFASPYLQRPLDLGADLVAHSATKYLGGHSDSVSGNVVVKDKKLAERLRFIQNAAGAVPGPMDCFLILRGIKTLHVRVERACKNARKIAKFLINHPKVDRVIYPGFKDHPNHKVAKSQMKDFGAMVSFDLKNGNIEDANKVLSSTKLFILAESLGGVESLIGNPASMTHGSIPKKERLKAGLTDSLIRLSVGIEDVRDLIDDLEKALVNV